MNAATKSVRPLAISLMGLTLLGLYLTVRPRPQKERELRTAKAETRLPPAPTPAPRTPAPGSNAAVIPPAPVDRTPARPRPSGNLADKGLLALPEYAALYKLYQAPALDIRYGRLFGKWDIGESDRSALKQLLLERDSEFRDAAHVAQALGLSAIRSVAAAQSYEKLLVAAADETNQGIEALLGHERYLELKKFENTLAERDQLSALERRAAAAAEPLTSNQFEALVDLLVKVKGQNMLAKRGFQSSQFRLPEGFISAAAPLLSERQTALLQQLEAEANARLAFGRQLAGAQAPGK